MAHAYSMARRRGLLLTVLGLTSAMRVSPLTDTACDADNGGLVLPEGLCATLVASELGPVRQLAVGPNGDLYAALSGKPGDGSGVSWASRDRDGDGKPDQRASFGPSGANDVELHNGYLYFALNDRVVRYRLAAARLEPAGKEETVVADLPRGRWPSGEEPGLRSGGRDVREHRLRHQQLPEDRPASRTRPGKDPCTELERRAGIWRFSADRLGQRVRGWPPVCHRAAERDGPGSPAGDRRPVSPRSTAAISWADNWGFSNEVNANNPAEELVRVTDGEDFGWPYCYYSNQYHRRRCWPPSTAATARRSAGAPAAKNPVLAFPGHWAPMALAFYTGDQFGPGYKGGLFVAFHGSWNRAPLPQEGYRVVFVPFANGRPTGEYSTFATDKSGPTSLRASGVAVAPDGSLYISADQNGKIWKVTRKQGESVSGEAGRLGAPPHF